MCTYNSFLDGSKIFEDGLLHEAQALDEECKGYFEKRE